MPHLYLIGYRGSGKTAVGELTAARLGRSFFDADVVLEADAGVSVSDLFATRGEPAFRDLEAETLQRLSAGPPAVVATGGGVILRTENRARLRATGFVVWLAADADTLWHRILSDPVSQSRRPNLTPKGGLDEVRTLLAVREPLYRETAHATVDAARSPERVAADILHAWAAWPGSRPPPA